MPNNREAPRFPSELFPRITQQREGSTDSEKRKLVLPLGALSQFVLEEQPNLLTAVREGRISVDAIVQRQKDLVRQLEPNVLRKAVDDTAMARFAMLDLSFAMSGITFSGGTPPAEVRALNAHFARITGLPEQMTFEKVISINSQLPFSQMRVFTHGEVGDSERDFYFGHDLMDRKMQTTISAISRSVDLLATQKGKAADAVVGFLTEGAESMNEFASFMRSFMKMPKEHFDTFRQYISQYPDGRRNASGAFIGMPRLNIRLVGLSPQYEHFLDEGMQYFPIDEQPDIQEARFRAQQGQYLTALCEGLEEESQKKVAIALISVIDPVKNFKLRHLAAVSHFVPQALPERLKHLQSELENTEEEPILDTTSTAAKGTAGFLPGPLLRNSLRLDVRALKRLKELL